MTRNERNALITRHQPLALALAWKHRYLHSTVFDLDDLRGVALGALVRAAERYEPSLGVPFDAYANPVIRGSLLDMARELDWVPRSKRVAAKRTGTEDQLLRVVSASLPVSYGSGSGRLEDMLADSRKTPQDEALAAEWSHALRSAMQAIPERQRWVLEQYYFQGLTMKEIARMLDRSEQRVHQLCQQALRHLRNRLMRYSDAVGDRGARR